MNMIECCKTESIVDVFQVVKALRIQNSGSVLTVVGEILLCMHVEVFASSVDNTVYPCHILCLCRNNIASSLT